MYAVANYSKKYQRKFPFLRNRIKDIKLLKTGLTRDLFIKCPIIILNWAK